MWLSSFLLGIVVVAAKMADKDVRIPVVKSELECEEHCTSLTACRTWTFEENTCAVTMLPHAFVAGSSDNGISLLQGGSCNIWEDPECGMVVDTFVFGDCTYGFANPDHCMGYCSKGCEFVRDPCEASCQPVITFELTIDTGNKKKKLLQLRCLPLFFEANLRTELLALWGAPDESIVELTSTCEDATTAKIRVTITPFSIAFPTTEFIASLSRAMTTKLSTLSHPILAKLALFKCIEGCDDRDPICETGVLNNEGDVCCAASCGTCGGDDCQARPGGAANCCQQNVRANGRSCNKLLPPCNIGICFEVKLGTCDQSQCPLLDADITHVPEGTYNLRSKEGTVSNWPTGSPNIKWGACLNYEAINATAGYKSYTVFDWATQNEADNALDGAILGQVVVEEDSSLCWFCGDSPCNDNQGDTQLFCLENTEFVCPTPNGMFSVSTCGSQFYHCSNGVPYLKDCADGGEVTLCFDPDLEACDYCSKCETEST